MTTCSTCAHWRQYPVKVSRGTCAAYPIITSFDFDMCLRHEPMKKIGIPIKGAKLTKAGKIEKAGNPKTSVSQKIAARKSKRVKVARRTP